MNRQENQTQVKELQELFQGVSHAILLDFRGLKVAETTELRRKVKEEQGFYRVVKNRLAIRASEGIFPKEVTDLLKGPTAVISGSGDFIAVSRILRDFSKAHPAMTLKVAWVDGQTLSAEGIVQMANLPGRDELISRFLGVLGAPLSRFCLVLQSPLRGLVTVLKEIGKQKA
ncbi:MAG: 50S ribosomal protein L10 [Acidobacteriota bacterium]